MKRAIPLDAIAEAKAKLNTELAKAKATVARVQKDYTEATAKAVEVKARLTQAELEQARIEGAIEALGGFK